MRCGALAYVCVCACVSWSVFFSFGILHRGGLGEAYVLSSFSLFRRWTRRSEYE